MVEGYAIGQTLRGQVLRKLFEHYVSFAGWHTVLDLGCGDGLKSRELFLGKHVTGIDLSGEKAEAASRVLDAVLCTDMIDFLRRSADQSFDCIAMFDALEHLPEVLGQQVLRLAQLKARRLVLVFTPEGPTSAWQRDHATGLQEHKSVWYAQTLRDCGLSAELQLGWHGPNRNAIVAWRTL